MNLLCTLLTIGLPAIDESLDKLLVAMETFPNVAVLGDAVGMARVIGLCLALCVGSYECWMMMLGRRGMDVMKLFRIVGISICISSSQVYYRMFSVDPQFIFADRHLPAAALTFPMGMI